MAACAQLSWFPPATTRGAKVMDWLGCELVKVSVTFTDWSPDGKQFASWNPPRPGNLLAIALISAYRSCGW
jgi:hypothetical protein